MYLKIGFSSVTVKAGEVTLRLKLKGASEHLGCA